MLSLNKFTRAERYLRKISFISQEADQINFIASNAEFKQCLLTLIAQAKSRIYLTALYFQNDEAGQEVLEALYQAKLARPELEIKILVDWHRAQRGLIGAEDQSSNADWYAEVRRKYNLPVDNDIAFYGVPVNRREIFGVLHLKGFIIDNTVLYSGASINNVYLHQLDRYRYDRYHQLANKKLADTFVSLIEQHILSDEVVRRLDEERPKTKEIRPLIKLFRKKLSQVHYDFVGQTMSDNELMISPLIGLGRKNRLNKTIEALFSQAQEKLIICTPYFNLPRSLSTRVSWLLSKGVQVEIIVGDKTANDFYTPPEEKFTTVSAVPYLYEKNLRFFAKRLDTYIQSGQLVIRLWKHEQNTYHLKGVWVDNRYVLLTGNNLNPRAWKLDAENAILISDPQESLKEKVANELQQIRTHTMVLTSYNLLDKQKDYPEKVRKLLRKLGRVRLDRIVRMLL
ncbi:CDP-diacylglycerol--serine O-phosphatidyltransferase [Otariodibacter sp.]|uniref:CDP-diacylglycerol--serine O-phosphatidyltransferase n=1 Tax=Otariodibacter sp. TaxID=3030919 RepID=UPI00260698DE|nr:CDP-diacylglycerol--serine O-phosphatidyltransferase [Otariodibacter sp.]